MPGRGIPGDVKEGREDHLWVIIDDHQLFAESLKFALQHNFPDFHYLLAYNGQKALQIASQHEVKLFLVDVHLPDMSGVELLQHLFRLNPCSQAVMLTVETTLEVLFQAIACGASGYLLKTSPLERICKDLVAILEGDLVISSEILPRLFARLRRAYGPEKRLLSPTFESLTPRELEVLYKVVQGKDNRTISQELFISEKTVKNHVAHILEKLGLPNRLQLIVFAFREGLLAEEKGPSGS